MSGPLSIRFAVSGGSATGLGHIMRCAAIASDARKRGLQVAFSLDGDEPAERTLRREVPDVQIDPWPDARALTIPLRSVAASSGPMETDETESNLVDSRHCDWVVFDTRRDLSLHLRTARSSGARTAVLDTLDYSNDADLTVLPVLHAPHFEHPRVLQGARYCVLAASIRGVNRNLYPNGEATEGNETSAKARDLILLTLGGADPLGLTPRVATALEKSLEEWPSDTARPELHCVVGSAFRDSASLASELRSQHWQVHEAPPRSALAGLMNRAVYSVVGFGTTVYELAYLGTPMVYLTHHRADAADAHRLANLGIGALGAEGHAFDGEALRRVLHQTLLDPDWLRAMSARGVELLGDGGGSSRILDALEAGCGRDGQE